MLMKYHPDVLSRHGRLADQVFIKRLGQTIGRQFTSPGNPRSTAQQEVRGAITAAAQAWSGVTEAKKLIWDAAAANYTRLDDAGNPYTLTGYQLYLAVNAYLSLDGQALVTDCPTYAPINDIVTLVSLTLTLPAKNWALIIGAGTIPNNSLAVIRCTEPVDALYASQDGDYRMPTVDPADSIVSVGAAAGGQFTINILGTALRTEYFAIDPADKVRFHIKILTATYLPPTLPHDAFNVSGILTVAGV